MKKTIKIIGAFAITAFLAFSTPVAAQNPDTTVTETRTVSDRDDDDDDDDMGKWGLAGLLGLLGLLGLKRRDNDHNDRPRTTTNR